MLGPDLFSDYSSPAAAIIRSFKVSVHCYADDTQLYRAFTPGEDELEVLGQMEQCISELRNWMSRNMLKLNDDKTEFIILGTDVSLKKVKIESIKVGNHEIKAVESVRNIGAMFDKRMKMKAQVKHMCKGAWYNIHSIGKIRQYLTQDQTKTVVHAHVISKLDNNNSLLTGIPQYVRRRLQLAQNAAAKLVTDLRKFDHVTGAMKELHWLPIEKRVIFKCLLIAYKALNGTGPSYIKEMLPLAKVYREGLRSSDDPLRIEESYYKSSSVCLFVCLSVCSLSPPRSFDRSSPNLVGVCRWTLELPLRGSFSKRSTGHFHFPLYYICTSLMPHAATAPLACSCRV